MALLYVKKIFERLGSARILINRNSVQNWLEKSAGKFYLSKNCAHPSRFNISFPLVGGWSKRFEETFTISINNTRIITKALVCSKNLTAIALALSQKICAPANAQFLQNLSLALKTFWAPLNFSLILEYYLKVGNVQHTNDISAFNSFLAPFFTDISKKSCCLLLGI